MDVRSLPDGRRSAMRGLRGLVLVFVLAGVGAGAIATSVVADTYRATAAVQVNESTGGGTEAPPEYPNGRDEIVSLSYVSIATGPAVLQPVAASFGGSVTEARLLHEVSASSSASSGVIHIHIHVTDRSAARAVQYANAVAAQVTRVLTVDSASDRFGVATVNVHQVVIAHAPASSVAAPWSRNVTYGGLAGLLLSILIAGVRVRQGKPDVNRLVPHV